VVVAATGGHLVNLRPAPLVSTRPPDALRVTHAVGPAGASRRRRLLPIVVAVAAALLLASAWVGRLSSGLQEVSTSARHGVIGVTGVDEDVVLTTDAGTVPMLDDVVLDPGEEVVHCVGVEARTLADPEPVVLHLDGRSSPLAAHLEVEIASGELLGDTDCPERVPTAVTGGSLATILNRLGPDGPGWTVADPAAGITRWWFRVRAVLDADTPSELQSAVVEDVTLRWSTATGELRASTLEERTERFVIGVTEDAALPLVLMVVAGLLFLGVQDRIDAHDPKLALAPVDRRTVGFTDRDAVPRAPSVPHEPPPSGPGRAGRAHDRGV
jgi:hypothetical protein